MRANRLAMASAPEWQACRAVGHRFQWGGWALPLFSSMGPVSRPGFHLHQRDTSVGIARHQRTLNGSRAAPAWQQRCMHGDATPSRNIQVPVCGRISPYATTIIRSGCNAASASTSASCFGNSGLVDRNLMRLRQRLTGLGVSLRPRPAGRSGWSIAGDNLVLRACLAGSETAAGSQLRWPRNRGV